MHSLSGESGNLTQIWAKPLPNGGVAVYFLNALGVGAKAPPAGQPPQNTTWTFDITLAELPLSWPLPSSSKAGAAYAVRDVWARKDLAPLTGGALRVGPVAGGSSRFLVLTPQK